MKTLLITCFLLLLTFRFGYSQQIRFENDALPEVMSKAKRLGKPVFILMQGPPQSLANLSAEARKATVESGLYNPAVTSILNKEFLNFEVPFNSAIFRELQKQYNVNQFPTYLYFDSEGSLVYRQGSTTTSVRRYLHDIEEFKRKSRGDQNLSYYKEAYAAGRRDADFLREYIQELNGLGITVEQELLLTYVNALTGKAFDSFSEVAFIHRQGPVVDSKAFKLARLNQSLVDSLYKTLPLPDRVRINNLIISNTMQQAIANKDRDLALKGANFARGTHNNDYLNGQKAFHNNMIRFYGSTGDTAQYLQQMVSYVDNFYMSVPIDSVKQMLAADSAALAAGRKRAEQLNQRISAGDSIHIQRESRVQTFNQPLTGMEHFSVLNNSAYAIYRTGTTNKQYLGRALNWSKRTVELAPNPAFYDTLAHLLYRVAFYSEAEAMQQKAVEMAREEKANTEHLQQELKKIKQRTL